MMEVIVIMMTIMIDGEYNVGYDNTIEQQKCLHFTPTHSHAQSNQMTGCSFENDVNW